jgi:uncharacterized protein YgiM (DUF1202 family)
MPSCGINFRYSHGFRLIFFLFLVSILLTPVHSLQGQTGSDVVVTNRYANIRTGPGTRYTRIGRVSRGERFPVIDTRPEWYKIMYKGSEAWIFSKLVRLEQSIPSPVEIGRVGAEINRLNQRLDRVLEKVNEAAERLVEKMKADSAQAAAQAAPAGKRGGVSRGAPLASPAWIFVPGGPRLATGDRLKGLSLIASTTGCLAASAYFHKKYRDYRDDYRALPDGSPAEQFDNLYDKSVRRRRLSESFLYAAAGLYAVNVLDYFLFLPRSGISFQVQTAPAGGQKVQLSVSRAF